MAQRVRLIVAGIARRGDEILLVQQQGPDDPQPSWALPGGRVEPGEGLYDALARELREETGLVVERPGAPAYLTQIDGGDEGQTLALVFEIAAWHGTLQHNDPDGFILQAAFVPLADALARLQRLPWPQMREPALAYLRGEVAPGRAWLYRGEVLGAGC